MPYTTDNIVDFIMDRNPTELQKAVDEIMASKVNDALEVRKHHLGNAFSKEFNNAE